jgi:N-methylhydantoinase B
MATREGDLKRDGELAPDELSILSKKFDAVTRDMTQSLLRSARAGIINVVRDFSSSITLFDGRQFMIDEGIPTHLMNIQYVPEYTVEHFDDISPGDCFLTNSPYAGNSHHADYTLHAPVFYDGEPLFWVINKAHQADVGAPEPTTYLADAESIYEEGTHFPSVRIQEAYDDKEDIVRMCKTNIRLGEEQWYGDYRAQISAVRTGEEELRELCDEYGVSKIQQFCEEWLAYGERMMRKEIADLPAETVSYTAHHDPIQGAPDGVPVNVTVLVEPDEERLTVDVTDNVDNLPNGFNLSRATTVAAAYAGVFNNVDPDVPHNQGSIGRITVEMGEGKVIGIPEEPVGTSVATTNVCDTLFNAVQAAFGELGTPYGTAEGNPGMPPNHGVISGTDSRRGGEQYIDHIMYIGGGGPASYGHDGWVTYGISGSRAVLQRSSVEMDERRYPILVVRNEVVPDSEGAGEWRGAHGSVVEYGPLTDPMTVAYLGNAREFPPAGILGGEAGAPEDAYKRTEDGERVELPIISTEEIQPGETIVGKEAGGGGYGDPLARDVEAVVDDVEAGLVSVERAEDTYGVVVGFDGVEPTVDRAATRRRREREGRE